MAGRTLQHRALADPTRERLLGLLRAAGAPQDVATLASALGRHQNTVRAHLHVLDEAGLVVAFLDHRSGRGRPPMLFSGVPVEDEQEQALLAASLASALEPLPEGVEIAARAGRSWGGALIERLEPGRAPSEETCVARVASLLNRHGFAPRLEAGELVMHRCALRELAGRYPRVVCSYHAGLIEGALEELGAPVVLERLEPWVSPATCVAHLAPRVNRDG